MAEIALHHADMREWLAAYDGPLFDSVVTDPPYELGFMGKSWDSTGVAFQPETWRAVFDRLKPGAHLAAFGGTRTYHRLAVAIEDAGFEIRDQLAWTYGAGFPKSLDVSKAIDKAAGVEREVVAPAPYSRGRATQSYTATRRVSHDYPPQPITAPATPEAQQWQGWGTALKPAWEPICLARKPLVGTVAANVIAHGTGALNIDGCRVEGDARPLIIPNHQPGYADVGVSGGSKAAGETTLGRWPANIIHDGSEEVLAGFPDVGGETKERKLTAGNFGGNGIYGAAKGAETRVYVDSGSAARFFYSAKAGPLDRIGSEHATVKPVDLMRWISRLITQPGGHVLDPFAGSGTTGIACVAEGFDCTLIELEEAHHADIARKLAYLRGEGQTRFTEHDRKREERKASPDHGPLFGGDA